MNYDVLLNANDSATLETEYAFTQGDHGNIQFSIRVKSDGQYVTDAERAYIVFTLSNGMIVTGEDMPKSVATYSYIFQGNELQSPGKVVADVKLMYEDGQISSNKFTFICRADPLAGRNIPAGPYITALQRIVEDGQQKLDYLQALIDALEGSIGETPITRNDLQSTRDSEAAGVKAIDAYLAQFMLLKGDLANNFLVTVPGQYPLDAAAGKTLSDKIGNTNNLPSGITDLVSAFLQTNSNLSNVSKRYFINFGVIAANSSVTKTVVFGTPSINTGYSVFVTTTTAISYWGNVVYTVTDKTTDGFKITAFNAGTFATGGDIIADWGIVRTTG